MSRALRRAMAARMEAALAWPLRHLPPPVPSAVGAWLGAQVVPRLYAEADANARRAFAALAPALDPTAATRAWWQNLAACFCEVPGLIRLWDRGRVAVVGAEHLQAARRAGPMLCAGLHLGNSEVLGMTLARLGLRPVGVSDRLEDQLRAREVNRVRYALGGRMIWAERDAVRPALEVLRAREETLMFWMDDFVGGAVRGPSLGRGPRTTGNIPYAVRLARLTGCAIVPGYVERVGLAQFRTTFLPAVDLPPASGDRAADVAAGAAALDAVLDPIVRARLTQWLFTANWQPA